MNGNKNKRNKKKTRGIDLVAAAAVIIFFLTYAKQNFPQRFSYKLIESLVSLSLILSVCFSFSCHKSLTMNTNQFQPIDHEYHPMKINNSHSIHRPIPISHSTKYNFSTFNLDTTVRSCSNFPRSATSDQLANHSTNKRLYYYPSVQDVLDALNRSSFDKESFV